MNPLLFLAGLFLIFIAIFMLFKQKIRELVMEVMKIFHRRKVKSMKELFSMLVNDVLDERSLKIWHDLYSKYEERVRRESNL